MDERYFSYTVVEWYLKNSRNLPWRTTKDPYSVWLSEIILQQTRVSQGLPYYLRFMEKYPSVTALANAKIDDVLRLWQGLGYYTRARNLHACARKVVDECKGVFPDTFEELKKLPGVGEYTAAAIASICFKQPVAVVDGNVFRVLARFFGIDHDIAKPAGKAYFAQQAQRVLDATQPDVYNQAIMEFGALQCTPRQPACQDCALQKSCYAFKHEVQLELPVKTRKARTTTRYFYYFVIDSGGKIAMRKRNGKDIWNGLYDFYLVETSRPVNYEKIMKADPLLKRIQARNATARVSATYKHILTHQVIMARFIAIPANKRPLNKAENLTFFSKKRIQALPKPILVNQYLTDQNIL